VKRLTRRFAGNVVRHACDAVDFVDDACRDLLEECKVKVVGLLDVLVPEPGRQSGMFDPYLGGHEVEGLDGTKAR